MGIQGLTKLIHQRSPDAVKDGDMKNYFGRRVAIDASMTIYQFIIAMKGFDGGERTELTNANGEVTSHLNGLWAKTIRMLEEGIKPVYVFDGKPPELKQKELDERREKAAEAEAALLKATEEGDDEAMEKFSKRTVRVSKDQMDECKKLLRLMGIPVVEAESEAEAQCVALVKSGKCWAVATEDMDALTFGAPILLRHLTYSQSKDRGVAEFRLDALLAQSNFTMDQFIDLCILLGCDYCEKIPGIGPMKAYEGIEKYKSIEEFIAHLDRDKHPIPENWPYKEARELFRNPPVTPPESVVLEWKAPDEEGLKKFMVEEKLFNAERIDNGIRKLKSALERKTQSRLEDFFKVIPKATAAPSSAAATAASRKRPSSGSGPTAPIGSLPKKQAGQKKAVQK
jgi:flap endonuclease-1